MKPGHFSGLAALSLTDLQARREDAVRLLDEARQHQSAVEQQVADTAPARLAGGSAADYGEAERVTRMAALRVADAERVLATVDAAIAAREGAQRAADDQRDLLAAVPARRAQLAAELERAQQQHEQALAVWTGTTGNWMTIEKPRNQGAERRMTIVGEGRWQAVRDAHAACERIRQALAGLDALVGQSEAREAA
jgi:hypothetical protein